MTAEPLLHELETLTHTARIRQMVDCGRAAKHDPQVAATVTALEQRDFYARFLAIYSCFGSRDGAHVLRALADPSRIIRGVAIKLVPLACDEAQQQQALEIIPRADRLSLLWKLKHLGNQPVIDAFLERLAEAQDLQLCHLLPCGSPTLVRQYISHTQPFMGLADWRRLTRHHPAIAFELLQTWAASATDLDLQLVAFVNAILPILVRKKPDMALELVQTLALVVSLNRLDLRALLVARPVPFVDFVLQQSSDLGDLDLSVIAHKLQNEHLLSLQATYPAHLDYYPPEWWLRRIPPARRTELYPIFQHIWHDRFRNRHVPAEIVALLPRPLREQEGRRLLALPSLAMHPEERLAYAVLLPWNEALGVLNPFLRDPGERVRTIALQTLVQLARYEREHVLDVLKMLQGHLHEPDPVWRVVLDHLCELPRGLWRREHLAAVEPILQGTRNAFDVSSNSFAALFLLITRFLDCAPEWSAAQFAQAAWVHGIVFQYSCIDNRLSDADVRQLGPALRPVLMSWAEKGLEEKLQGLLSTFGKRVRVFEELLDALELIFTRKISFDFGNEILSTLIAYRPARAAQLLPELLQGNRTGANQRRRQAHADYTSAIGQYARILTLERISPALCGVASFDEGYAQAHLAHGNRDAIRVSLTLLKRGGKIITKTRGVLEDEFSIRITERTYGNTKAATLLAAGWPREALEVLTNVMSLPQEGDMTRQNAYTDYLWAQTNADLGLIDAAATPAQDAFVIMKHIKSRIHIQRIAGLQGQLNQLDSKHIEVIRLGVMVNS